MTKNRFAAPIFPTIEHSEAASVIQGYFETLPQVDTILVVNSCARGQAAPESDLDFAILVKQGTDRRTIAEIENQWQEFSKTNSSLLKYHASSPFHLLHLDVIEGDYQPTELETGIATDGFELEIGNQMVYSAALGTAGQYFGELRAKWLPYYSEELRDQRLTMLKKACLYQIEHIPHFVRRELYFQAFDTLTKAFQGYLQTLFVHSRVYPIAYNKWIKYQIVDLLKQPDLYRRLLPILSLGNLESSEVVDRAATLRELLDEIERERQRFVE